MEYFHTGKLLWILDNISESFAIFHMAFEIANARFKDVFQTSPF